MVVTLAFANVYFLFALTDLGHSLMAQQLGDVMLVAYLGILFCWQLLGWMKLVKETSWVHSLSEWMKVGAELPRLSVSDPMIHSLMM